MILALDTSGAELVVCLLDRGLQVKAWQVLPGRRHQDVVIDVVNEVLGGAPAVAALEAIAVVRGPGSQTGLRVGLSTALGMAYGGQLQMLPLNSLAVAAMRCSAPTEVVAVVSAGRSNVFAQRATSTDRLVGSRVLCALADVGERVEGGAGLPIIGEPGLVSRAAELGLPAAVPARPSQDALAGAVRGGLSAGALLAYHQLTGDYGES